MYKYVNFEEVTIFISARCCTVKPVLRGPNFRVHLSSTDKIKQSGKFQALCSPLRCRSYRTWMADTEVYTLGTLKPVLGGKW